MLALAVLLIIGIAIAVNMSGPKVDTSENAPTINVETVETKPAEVSNDAGETTDSVVVDENGNVVVEADNSYVNTDQNGNAEVDGVVTVDGGNVTVE